MYVCMYVFYYDGRGGRNKLLLNFTKMKVISSVVIIILIFSFPFYIKNKYIYIYIYIVYMYI